MCKRMPLVAVPRICVIDTSRPWLHQKDLAFFAWQKMGERHSDGRVVLGLARGSVRLPCGTPLSGARCSPNILSLLGVHVDSGASV